MFPGERDRDPVSVRIVSEPPAELRLLDAYQRRVLEGYEVLQGDVMPGVYTLEVRAAEGLQRRTVRIEEGGHRQTVHASTRSAAPLPDSLGFNPAHLTALDDAMAQSRGAGAALVVMIRDVGRADSVSAEAMVERLGLVDPAGVALQLPGWTVGPGCAVVAVDVSPGPYLLHTLGTGKVRHDRPLWLVDGVTHALFVPTGPSGLSMDHASVHTARAGRFDPAPFRHRAEAAYGALRTSGRLLSNQVMESLLQHKLIDPWAGVLFSTLTLVRSSVPQEPDEELQRVDFVLERIGDVMQEHPDWLALRAIARLAAQRWSASGSFRFEDGANIEVGWPPTLGANFLGLVEAQRAGLARVASGSAADLALDRLLGTQPFTTLQAEVAPQRRQTRGYDLESVIAAAGRQDRGTPPATALPTTVRVAQYVEFAAQTAPSEDQLRAALSKERVAQTLGVTSDAAVRALSELARIAEEEE
ncbi:MAG: hypothetical protein KTR31_41260 [Myxococcales bacterium]|nr:hypothetical protein [Myxococcales bacterium]